MDGVEVGAKTRLHMVQLHDIGNSFVIQLKNGHFVIYDGGQDIDAPYLLDYLDSLTPGDEKPVIEAWFFSHAHWDHTGALINISNHQEQIDRIYLRGIYFTDPNLDLYNTLNETGSIPIHDKMSTIHLKFRDENGQTAKAYRMHLGQRYYFCDVMIDVALTIEQIEKDAYTGDFNDTSTWLMAHIDGQKFLCAGDTNEVGMKEAMQRYEEEYFELDVWAVFHHGINLTVGWMQYCSLKTVLFPYWRVGSPWNPETDWQLGGKYTIPLLEESFSKECVSHGEGTVVLTFPYEVGERKLMEPCDWRYDDGVQQKNELSSQ